MPTLDSVLNVLIPTILVLILVAFVWLRTPLGAWLGPHLSNLWAWMKGESQAVQQRNKVIVYE